MVNSMKSISTINPAITENTKYSIVKVCASFINLKVGVSLVTMLHFTSSSLNILGSIPSKE